MKVKTFKYNSQDNLLLKPDGLTLMRSLSTVKFRNSSARLETSQWGTQQRLSTEVISSPHMPIGIETSPIVALYRAFCFTLWISPYCTSHRQQLHSSGGQQPTHVHIDIPQQVPRNCKSRLFDGALTSVASRRSSSDDDKMECKSGGESVLCRGSCHSSVVGGGGIGRIVCVSACSGAWISVC